MAIEAASSLRMIRLPEPDQVFGVTLGMRAVRRAIEEAMRDYLPVLIEGESGTGKEVVARYLHDNSLRAPGPFVRIPCGWMHNPVSNKEILEASEEARGSQFEAEDSSIRLASDGTAFFDGIADMDRHVNQRFAKAVRVAESVSARIVCASSSHLSSARDSEATRFDPSSFFHHRVHLLPLRERKQDIPILCEYLIGKFSRSFSRPIPRLSSYVLESFQQWNWPGNIRELENWVARIVIFGTEETIGHEFRRQVGSGPEFADRLHRAIHQNLIHHRRSRRRGRNS